MPLSARRKPARRLPPEVLTTEEVNALIAAIHGDTVAAVRNRALIAFLYRTGLRISEALSVYPKDIDSAGLSMLTPWIERRVAIKLNDRHPFFCTCWGTPLTTAYVRRLLPQLAANAGITKRVHAHGLRHTHASELREEGIDIGIISKQLGHADISTTARYLDHIAPWAVVERISERTWA